MNYNSKLIIISLVILIFFGFMSCTPPEKPVVNGIWYDQSVDNGDKLTLQEDGNFSIEKYNPATSAYDIVFAEGTYTVEQEPVGFNKWENRIVTTLTKLLGLVDIGDIEALPYEIPNTDGLKVVGIKQSYSVEVNNGELLLSSYNSEDSSTIDGEWKQHNSVILVIEYLDQEVDVTINLGKELTINSGELSVKYYKLNMGDPIKPNPLEWSLDEIVESVTYTDNGGDTFTVSDADASYTVLLNGTYKYKKVGDAMMFSYPTDGGDAAEPSYYTQQ